MKRTITRTETKTIEVCDVCERDANNGFHRDCSICGKRCCLTCCRAIFPEVENGQHRVIDWQLNVCHVCEAIGHHHLHAIQWALQNANNEVVQRTRQWRGLVPGKYTDNKRDGE